MTADDYICSINGFLSFIRKYFYCLRYLSLENNQKCIYGYMFPKMNSAHRGLRYYMKSLSTLHVLCAEKSPIQRSRFTKDRWSNRDAFHDDVIKWKPFPCSGPLWGESTGHRWIPLIKASDAELWCLILSAPQQRVMQTIETPVIWDAIAVIMTPPWCLLWDQTITLPEQKIGRWNLGSVHSWTNVYKTFSTQVIKLPGSGHFCISRSRHEGKWVQIGFS